MRLRKRYLPLVALLGAALAVIPAMASSTGSSTATVSGLESIMWSPMEVAITPGGTVTFKDTSRSVPHGIIWKSGNPETPACSGVPVNEGKTEWEGSCTFSKEGTYNYECYVHHMYMTGRIYVNTAGTIPTTTITTTTTTTPTTTTPTTTTPTTTTPTTTSTTPTTTGTTPTTTSTTPTQTTATTSQATAAPPIQTGTGQQPAGGSSSPLHANTPHDSLQGGSLRLATSQTLSVHGSIEVAQAGSRLEIELLAPSASIATAARSVVVGHLLKAKVSAGRFSFKIAPSGRLQSVLTRRGQIALTVRIVLTPPHGTRLTRTLTVTLRR